MRYCRNVYVNYAFTFIKNLNVTQGIWMLYLASKGMSLVEIGMLEGIFHVASLVMETPTGAVADIFGRKASRLTGIALSVLSCVLMIMADSFAMFAVSFAVTALSYNFESGAGEALVYDSLLAEGKESAYFGVAGKTEIVFQLTGIVALAVGGAVGGIKYVYVYYLAIALSIAAFAVGFLFREPECLNHGTKRRLVSVIKRQYVESFRTVRRSGRLLYIILLTSVISASATLSFYYIQIEWGGYVSTFVIGIYLASSSLASATGAFFAERLEKRFGESVILKSAPVAVAMTVAAMYFANAALAALCVLCALEAVVFVATRAYINRLIPSEQRATILSFESVVFSLIMILTFPLFGAVSDSIGISAAFLILGSILIILSLGNVVLGTKKRVNESGRHSKRHAVRDI